MTGCVSLEVPCWGGERDGVEAFLLLLTLLMLDLLDAELTLPRLLVEILGALFSVSQLHCRKLASVHVRAASVHSLVMQQPGGVG